MSREMDRIKEAFKKKAGWDERWWRERGQTPDRAEEGRKENKSEVTGANAMVQTQSIFCHCYPKEL